MGYPMARQLLKAGHEVALWTHSGGKAQELAKEGKGRACATPKEVAQHSEFIFYCVGTTDMARSVALGQEGLLEGIRPGSVTADCSTISPAESVEMGAAFTARGAHFLDAPCTGSKMGSENATLTFMVGGDPVDLSRSVKEVASGERGVYSTHLHRLTLLRRKDSNHATPHQTAPKAAPRAAVSNARARLTRELPQKPN